VGAGGGWSTNALQLPLYFDGRRVNKRTLHIVRFSAKADMYAKGIPSAPNPPVKQKATLHAAVAAPPPGKVTHVDLFLSTVRPYWPNENKTRAQDAGMGPIVNSAGLYLTAVNYQWWRQRSRTRSVTSGATSRSTNACAGSPNASTRRDSSGCARR
jgi:hypothetical protein